MKIYRHNTLLPITATGVVDVQSDKILLVGEGPFVKLFSLAHSLLLDTILIFETQAIHGISCSTLLSTENEFNFLCIVWGARSFLFLRLRFRQNSANLCLENATVYQEIRLDDWVLDAKFVPDDGRYTSRVVLLDAHNNLFCLSCPLPLDNIVRIKPTLLASGPSSALYCGNIQFDTKGNILVASGTVFGGVHLWTTESTNGATRLGRLVAVYAGHEGSVYGILLSKLKAKKGYSWVIITCSDDRTIKLWNFGNELHKDYFNSSVQDLETGFTMVKSGNSLEAPIASNTGHLSRIWRIAAASVVDHESTIISFGEDATVQLWQLQSDNTGQNPVLNKGRSISLHTGKNIWTGLMIEEHAENQTLVVTGGADARLAISNLNVLRQHTTWSSNLSNDNDLILSETLRSFCWLSRSRLLAASVTGCLFLGVMRSEDRRHNVQWLLVTRLAELSEHVLLHRVDPDHALVAGSFGHVYLFSAREMKAQLLLKMHRKITFIFGSCSLSEIQQGYIKIVIVCLGISKLYTGVVSWNVDSKDVTEDALEHLNLPTGFIVTSAQYLEPSSLAIGSRNGNVAVCQINQKLAIQRFDLLFKVHGKETITSIQSLEGHEWILTTGRDGHFRIHKIQYGNEGLNFTPAHSGKLPFGPEIEGAEFTGGELHIWGFKGSEFVLWNYSLQQEIATIDCGGRRRSWSFFHGSLSMLAWSRTNTPVIASLRPSSLLLQHGTHGREIKALAIRQNKDTLEGIFATGAEDTCIRLSRYDNLGRYRTLTVIPTHTTGLQKLAWSTDGSLLFSAAGKEEFLVWQVQPIPVLEVGVRLLAKCPPVNTTQILRIMDFDIIEDKTFTIVMVCSDSSIRLWHFDPEQGSFELHAEAIYSTCCITQCKILGNHLLTASTDGSLVFWGLNGLSRVSRQSIHQSSIKCLEIKELDGGSTLVATGGDDGALAFCLFDLSDTSNRWIKLIIPKAHASAINALTLVSSTASQHNFITVSNDQRVKKWAVSIQENANGHEIVVKRSGNHASSVADASCIQSFIHDDRYNIVVAGVGLEFWKEEL